MWMNEYDIDEAVDIAARHFPDLERYAVFLRDWRDTVNENSDGWPYWRAGTKCADKLSDHLQTMKLSLLGRGQLAAEDEFKKALAPIKAAAKKFDLPAPELNEQMTMLARL